MRVYELSGGFGLENLKVSERSLPRPGPGQAVVKMHACSLNYRDLLVVNGSYNPRQSLPLIPLSDGVGEVVETGEGVSRVEAGQRVAGIFAQKWLDGPLDLEARASTLGGPQDGVLAEYRLFHQDGLVHVPEPLSYEEASTLPCAGVTAFSALVEHGGIRPGESVLLLGTGGVSLFALQFAKLSGARVIVTSSSNEKLEKVRSFGADDTINYREIPDWDKKVRRMTGTGVDHVVEVGGAGTLPKSLNSVKLGGSVYVIGVLSGVTAEIPVTSIMMKQVRVQGILVGSRRMFESMNRAVVKHRLRPVIDQVFDFDHALDAFDRLAGASHFGKVVINFK